MTASSLVLSVRLTIGAAAVAEPDDGPPKAPRIPSPWRTRDPVVRAAPDEDQSVRVDKSEVGHRSATTEQPRKKRWPGRRWGG